MWWATEAAAAQVPLTIRTGWETTSRIAGTTRILWPGPPAPGHAANTREIEPGEGHRHLSRRSQTFGKSCRPQREIDPNGEQLILAQREMLCTFHSQDQWNNEQVSHVREKTMSTLRYEEKRILIWGKTAPELSRSYYETVCTGGVLEDGTPIRLYPIDFRYLDNEDKFKKYQWITARIAKNPNDPRPESYRIDCDSIVTGATIPTDDLEWRGRREFMFQQPGWQVSWIEGEDGLLKAQKRDGTSLAVVEPRKILRVALYRRPQEEAVSFEQKREDLLRKNEADRAQLRFCEELMPPAMKELHFVPNRVRIDWLCQAQGCPGHSMQVMDWEVVELQRKKSDQDAVEAVQKHMDLDKYAVRFFLGNMHLHPTRFTIVGLWYPKRVKDALFV
jgi:hypothetical protein